MKPHTDGRAGPQARYQRHMENYHQHHAKRSWKFSTGWCARKRFSTLCCRRPGGDSTPREAAFAFSRGKVIDVVRLDIERPSGSAGKNFAAIDRQDAKDDSEKVEHLIETTARRPGVVGVPDVLARSPKVKWRKYS